MSDWEDLPDGEWLESDEHGVHWYLTNDGQHWHSTEDGYRLWVEDDDASDDEVAQTTNTVDTEDDDNQEPEDDGDDSPLPRLSVGTVLLSNSLALFVLAWTLFITLPTGEHNLELFTSDFARTRPRNGPGDGRRIGTVSNTQHGGPSCSQVSPWASDV